MNFDRYLNYGNRLDISNWESLGLELKGTRNKTLVKDPIVGETYLFKTPKHDHEIFNEVFNSILCNQLEIKHVSYYNAIRNGICGVLCKSFLKSNTDEELWEMRELLTRHSKKISGKNKLYGRSKLVLGEHNIENIFLILKEEFENDMMPKFFQMFGFDALIGHTDRHWENYGFIICTQKGELQYRFSPIYDTVSSYAYSSLDKTHIETLLKKTDNNSFFLEKNDKFSKISLPNEVIKINHFDLLTYVYNDSNMSKYAPYALKAVRKYNHQLGKDIFSRYFKKLDENHKKLVLKILLKRRDIALSLLTKK